MLFLEIRHSEEKSGKKSEKKSEIMEWKQAKTTSPPMRDFNIALLMCSATIQSGIYFLNL
jgi:hypothetical protein